jgi:tetratricopeptide (TPR) repeat protein
LTQKDTASRVVLLLRARQAVEKAIETDARVALFHARRGWILAHLITMQEPSARTSDVRESFATAIERDPANRNILELEAEAWLLIHRHAQARAAALRCIETYPEASAKPLGYIGLMALREGRWADAADTLALAASSDWQGDSKAKAVALANLSAAYIEAGRYAEGKAAAEEALANDPDLPAASKNREAALRLIESAPSR